MIIEHPVLHGGDRMRTTTRVAVDGRHLRADGAGFRIRGVTYGSFLSRLDGEPFPEPTQVKQDFRDMADLGLNVVRTYAPPPADVLEIAEECGLRLIVGLHYHDWRMETSTGRAAHGRVRDDGLRAVEAAMARCAGNASILAISVGNEVPGDLVRVHGIRQVESVLGDLVAAVHDADAGVLVTYSNYPTTEYLSIEGLDLVSFNVFLERPDQLGPYLRHLQIVAGDRPLLVSELGLASLVHGLDEQSSSLEWQLQLVDETGCSGATVFSWTDEWGVAGAPVEGWGFGITDDERTPKPAAQVVQSWARRDVSSLRDFWPAMSVVVCAYNEAKVIEECLESLERCTYPDLEVIVCDDGSTDGTGAIAAAFPFRLLELDHGGLSRARNAGIEAATGEIVAFLDADAYCHPDWPYYLALSLEDPGVVATGGPNLPVVDAPFAERAVAYSPGGPIHVLTSDDRAEHVPGCNMAFRKESLQRVGGFDAVFTSAGDDVDVCWKLLDEGGQIAFAPAAQIRHHRRDSLRRYLRQQRNYGRSERMVASRHRHRFNRLGQARWSGVIYGGQRLLPSLLRPVVYHGYQGRAPFQTVTHRRAESAMGWAAALLPLMLPLVAIGLLLAPFTAAGMWLAGVATSAVAGYAAAVFSAFRPARAEPEPLRMRATVTWLHLAQPIVRAWGRLRGRPLEPLPAEPLPWHGDRGAWLRDLEQGLRTKGLGVHVGAPSSSWDLAASGIFATVRVKVGVAWKWQPLWRQQRQLRPLGLAVLAIGALGGVLLTPVCFLVIAIVMADTLWVDRVVAKAHRSTTAGYR